MLVGSAFLDTRMALVLVVDKNNKNNNNNKVV